MDEHIEAMIALIISMADIDADGWMKLAEMYCGVEIQPAKRKTLTRLFTLMDASERLHSLTVMLMLSKDKLSDPFIDLGFKRGSLALIAAYIAIN